jgi:hypothetical protein
MAVDPKTGPGALDRQDVRRQEPSEEQMDNRLILVAGSGRSGTSLLAGILKEIGGHVPQPEVVADDTNPFGFSEPKWVVDFHTRLLRKVGVYTSDARPSAWAKTAELGRDWDIQRELDGWLRREFGNGDHVVIKDPRLLWFITLWRKVGETIAAPCFLTTLRHPLQVIMSKQTYYGGRWHPNTRVGGWLNTMLYTERATRGNRRAVVRYDDLLSDWMQSLAKVSEELDLALLERAVPGQMRAAARLVDPSLRRARATWSSLGVDDPLVELAEETWGVLDRAATSGQSDSPSLRSDLDRLRERYVELYAFAETLAQPSVYAGGSQKRRREGTAPAAQVSSARRTVRRVKRRIRQTKYRWDKRSESRTDEQEAGESSPSVEAPQR